VNPGDDPASALRVRQVAGAPLVAVRIVLPGGARAETIPGQSLVCGRMLAEGTRRRNWSELAAAAESFGASSLGYGGPESHGLVVDALAEHVERAIELAAEQLLEPCFPDDRLRWVTRHAAGELEALADQADQWTALAFAELLYGPHPKGRPLQGDAASLARMTVADCQGFHDAALAAGGRIHIAGAIDPAAVERQASDLAKALGPPRAAAVAPPAPPPAGERRREIPTRARDQAHLFVGQLTVGRRHPDFAALEIAGIILGAGAGLTGRIPFRLRDQEGLAYAASADTVAGAGLDAGRLIAYIGTSPENLDRAERGIREELGRLVTDGVSEQEVEEARSYLLGREPFRRESARQWADLAAQGALLDLPLEDPEWRERELRAAGREEVERAVRGHLDVTRLAVAVGTPLSRSARRKPPTR